MTASDRKLGMHRAISRRDLLLGAGAVASSAFVPSQSFADEMLKSELASTHYPPALTGLRGSHVGSFEVAHQLGWQGKKDWGTPEHPDDGEYDLVIVGGGVSGLAAAHFFRREQPNARILILDNHDDFGGHAKRNEFSANGQTLLTHGGSEILEEPDHYSDNAKSLFADLNIFPSRLGAGFNADFYEKNNLSAGIHFDKATFGVDKTMAFPLVDKLHYLGWIPVADSRISAEDAIAEMPISGAAKKELSRLLLSSENVLEEQDLDSEDQYLRSISYEYFLRQHMQLKEPEIYTIFENLMSDWCVGIEAVPALQAFYWGLPGVRSTSRGGDPERMRQWFGEDTEIGPTYHFPDGNASVARAIVRSLIPDVAPGSTAEDLIMAKFDYSKLDQQESKVRIRLESTVVNVEHDGPLDEARRVGVTYVRDGQASRVWAKKVVLACYNQIIPHLCPDLSESQAAALKTMVKSPILYSNVALRNWKAWKNLGVGAILNPGAYHTVVHLEYPVDFGGHKYPRNPEEPAIVHMVRFPHRSGEGLTPSQQKQAGRHEIYSTPFETIERNIRQQLAASLGPGGFDPGKDIEGITVNRWAHAYIDRANPLYDEIYADKRDERYPFVRGRKPFGRVAIANADSGSSSLLNVAIDQAYRAISELS